MEKFEITVDALSNTIDRLSDEHIGSLDALINLREKYPYLEGIEDVIDGAHLLIEGFAKMLKSELMNNPDWSEGAIVNREFINDRGLRVEVLQKKNPEQGIFFEAIPTTIFKDHVVGTRTMEISYTFREYGSSLMISGKTIITEKDNDLLPENITLAGEKSALEHSSFLSFIFHVYITYMCCHNI